VHRGAELDVVDPGPFPATLRRTPVGPPSQVFLPPVWRCEQDETMRVQQGWGCGQMVQQGWGADRDGGATGMMISPIIVPHWGLLGLLGLQGPELHQPAPGNPKAQRAAGLDWSIVGFSTSGPCETPRPVLPRTA